MDARYIYDDRLLRYQFHPDHPFNPRRLAATTDLIRGLGLLPQEAQVAPVPATEEDLLLAHSPHYVDLVRRLSDTGRKTYGVERLGLGTEDNPIFAGMHEAGALAVGATMTAARLLVEGRTKRAVNLSGGLHHAGRGHAAGFCIYNDLVAAIRWVRRETGWRVLYVETDAHHGDGVQDAFYEDPAVFVLSLHESGQFLFPGTGHVHEMGDGPGLGTTLNVPLAPATEDASWLEAFTRTVPRVVETFQPDLVVSQHGCDGHYWDPLADLCATTRFYRRVPELLSQWIDQDTAGRWLVTGGGGYQALSVVPRAWSLLWAGVQRISLGDSIPIPQAWLDTWQPLSEQRLPADLMDDPEQFRPVRERARIEATNRATLDAIARQFPTMGFGTSTEP